MSNGSEHEPTRFTEIVYAPDGDAAVVDIYAIHSLWSNATTAWIYRNSGTQSQWLKDILPTVDGLEDIRVIQVNHQSRWQANSAQMQFNEHAEMILEDIEALHKQHPERPIIFIAHREDFSEKGSVAGESAIQQHGSYDQRDHFHGSASLWQSFCEISLSLCSP